jgi:hypothetical protein
LPEFKLSIRPRGIMVKIMVRNPATRHVHPAPVSAFLDTGASDTMIDVGIVNALKVEASQCVGLNILGRADTGFYEIYPVEIALVAPDAALRWISLDVLGGPCFQTGAPLGAISCATTTFDTMAQQGRQSLPGKCATCLCCDSA